MTASICFLIVTLGTTFSAAWVAGLSQQATLPPELAAQQAPLSATFLAGILMLLTSFGLGGWIRSRTLGWATTVAAVLGLLSVAYALAPFVKVTP